MIDPYEYDVAVSYAGPDKDYAHTLSALLKEAELLVFFDLFEEATILGKRLATFLQDAGRLREQGQVLCGPAIAALRNAHLAEARDQGSLQ